MFHNIHAIEKVYDKQTITIRNKLKQVNRDEGGI
jgi:hypothetical protein